ncbi:MAG: hypothetical protein RSE91_02725 [Bacilli bacterium]
MKKVIYLLIIYLFIIFIGQKQLTKTVSFEKLANDSRAYYVYIDKINLTSRNITNYFNREKIILIYPQNKFNDEVLLKKLSTFKVDNIEKNYIKILNEYLLTETVDKVYRNGILIDKVLIKLSKEELKTLKKENKYLMYSKYLNGKYL